MVLSTWNLIFTGAVVLQTDQVLFSSGLAYWELLIESLYIPMYID